MQAIKTILHPTDFSESSKHAMSYAINFAQEFQAKLILLHVIEEISSALYFDMLQAPPLTQLMVNIEKQARQALDEVLPPELRGKLPAEYILRKGVPFVEILNCATHVKADMIVLGTHGRTGLKHALFGSVAEKVVRKASCPVLSVRHPSQKFVMPG
ncbi:MAG: universal stress protein [Candidatus Brocadiia bacterium]